MTVRIFPTLGRKKTLPNTAPVWIAPPKKFCVLIPAYNEEQGISKSILSAYTAGVKPEDIYVIDDGSKDNTADVASKLNAQVLIIQNHGKSKAMKKGLEHFQICERYEWVAIIDADSIVDEKYISAMEKSVKKYPTAALICGNQRSQCGSWNWLTAFRAVEYDIWCSIYREAQHNTGTVTVAPGFASVYRADVLNTLDFDAGTLVEDMDMTIQLQRRGKLIVYARDAIVYTQDPLTLRDFIGQIKRWYIGTWQVMKRHRLGRQFSRVDAEIALLTLDTLIGATFICLVPLLLVLFPRPTLLALLFNQIFILFYAIRVAIRDRRIEVLIFWPTFIVPRFIGTYLFIWAFFAERRTRHMREIKWFSVQRY